MLIPDHIPEQEPEINVGIILPEDNISGLTLTLPGKPAYILSIDNKEHNLTPDSRVSIQKTNNNLEISIAEKTFEAKEVIIKPVDKNAKITQNAGIKADPVIAGRGFHWQKYIHVYLPDSLIIRNINDDLVLINQLPLEHYVMCVATSEMSAACPEAMIEAQTIAARSWLLANVEQKHRHLQMDVCNDDCCQRYQGTTYLSEQSVKGALKTAGQVLIYNAKICDARYSKSCGGMMETFGAIWPGHDENYLQNLPDAMHSYPEIDFPLNSESNLEKWVKSVPDSFCSPHTIPEDELKKYLGTVDEEGTYFRWTIKLTNEQLRKSLSHYAGIAPETILDFEVISRGGSGRINKLRVFYLTHNKVNAELIIDSEYNVRRFLSEKFLYSSAITIKKIATGNAQNPDFEVRGAGWGHGVGLCQIGALGMSLNGYKTSEILNHYYPGSQLKKIY